MIRPSQVTRTFGPGSIYDNQRDSVLIMGLNYWDPEKFKSIDDKILLQEIKKRGFTTVKRLISTSSFVDPDMPGKIPVRSFPRWGFCPRCQKLVPGRDNKTGRGMHCDSVECNVNKRENGIANPSTYPVRFVAVCENGHLDEFPWYEWVHKKKSERDVCGAEDAKLYLITDTKSISLESVTVECRGKYCVTAPQRMTRALSKNGLKFITMGCTKQKPWLGKKSSKCEDNDGNPVQMRGIFKGATNMYFPLVISTVTIPPFSDDLAEKITGIGDQIVIHKNKGYYKEWLTTTLALKPDHPDGRWTLDYVLNKIKKMEEFSSKNEKSIYELEFGALNFGENTNDKEFITENLNDIPSKPAKYIHKAVLVKKMRVISAITGFTRIDPYDPAEKIKISRLSDKNTTWLPAIENRGEGIFFSFDNTRLDEWQSKPKIKDRFDSMMTIQGKLINVEDYRYNPKYVFLHTLSHVIMKSIAKLAGYTTASLTERIYCGRNMAGIFIFTSSPSSDGALGGLVGLGSKGNNKLWHALENAIHGSFICSSDPFCSMQEPSEHGFMGAACHACILLPETCCENMNMLLDREMIDHTLRSDIGFLQA